MSEGSAPVSSIEPALTYAATLAGAWRLFPALATRMLGDPAGPLKDEQGAEEGRA